nr:MAG TPA: antitoxin [Caudoviricetes sp.]DAM81750.1 MAG TPA: antitoxin [Caudoviricetes sp.]
MEKKQLTLRIDRELFKLLQEDSERRYIPITDLINIILSRYFENNSQE